MKKENLLGKIISKEVLNNKMLKNITAGDPVSQPPRRPNFPSPPPTIREDDYCAMQAYCLSYAVDRPERDYCMITYPCGSSR